MPQTDKTSDYLREVCTHIRWKRAHEPVRKELAAHIDDQREALIAAGTDESTADGKAVDEMGDAATVGLLLDRSYRPKPAWGIIAITAALMVLGFFARMYISNKLYYVTIYTTIADLTTNIIWLAAAIAALIVGYFLDFTILVKYPRAIRVGFYAILAFAVLYTTFNGHVLYGGYGRLYKYAHYLLLLFPPVLSSMLCSSKNKGYMNFASCYACIAATVIIGLYIPYFAIAITCWFIGLLLLTFALYKNFFRVNKLFALLAMYLPPVFLFILLFEPIMHRLHVSLNPEADMYGSGFVGSQIKAILVNARMLGEGGYMPKANFLPYAHSEYVLAFFIHHTGWISLIIIAALFSALFAAACVLVYRQKNRLGQMVSAAVLLVLMAEFVIYVVVNLGFTMFASISLPLISYGNAALVTNAFLIGLMLSVFRTGDLVCDKKIESTPDDEPNSHTRKINFGNLCFEIAVYRTNKR